MKNDYILYFVPSKQGAKFHDSYLTALDNTLSEIIKAALKKHGHLGGEYTALVTLNKINNPSTTDTHILLNKSRMINIYLTGKRQNMCVATFGIDFSSDNMAADEADSSYLWIDPTEDILKYPPKFNLRESYVLPSEEKLEEQSHRATENFLKSFNSFRFPCELRECDFPDVIYEVSFETPPNKETTDKVLHIIEKWSDKYNRRNKHSDRCIHIVQALDSEKIPKGENSVLIHVDFGECNALLIRNVIRQLNKSDLKIKGVIIR